MRKRDLQLLVQSYCLENNVKNRWKDSKPGKDWIRGFQKRWKHKVKMRKPNNIKRSRAKVSPDIIRDFFANVAPNLENVPATHIFNYDETNFQDDPGSEDAFFGGGCKYYEQAQNSSKVAFSVMFCCSAAGDLLPPMVLFNAPSGALFQTWSENGPEGATYAANESGWFKMDSFNAWFKQVFLAHIRTLPREDIKVIIGDNLSSHLSPYVTMLCELHNIRFIFLPENSTHIMQPLDVAVFAPMKDKWKQVLRGWKLECDQNDTSYATLPKKVFPSLLKATLEKDYSESIRSGFEATGLYPVSLDRALGKFPAERPNVDDQIQEQLLERLNALRYNPRPNAQTTRARKKDKLPAGASYTCAAGEGVVHGPLDADKEMEAISRRLARRRAEEDHGGRC